MDAYEATRVVFSRIQGLDPENAAKIMGLLLLQDPGEKGMIRLAFGPEALLHSLLHNVRKDLGLLSPSSGHGSSSPFNIPSQGSGGATARLRPPPLTVGSPTWAPPTAFSRTPANGGAAAEEKLQQSPEDSPFYGGGGDAMDEFLLQEQLSFLNDSGGGGVPSMQGAKFGEPFYPEECRSPGGLMFPYHRRSCSVPAAEPCLGSVDPSGLGWKPCLYYARGYCKNGSNCRFLHGLPEEAAVAAARVKVDAVEQQCHELLFRSKSARLGGSAQPFSLVGSPSSSSPGKCFNFLLQQQQQQQSDRAAAAATTMIGGRDDAHKFLGRPWLERAEFAGMMSPGSRQIYLTFPADSTFREEDVSNYFSIYGPVQDVRIPYQQKRMFGFVTFVFPETVKMILAKGNPHFVCDARVLVKPYKDKGKVPDKYRKQQQLGDRGEFSGCSTPTAATGLDAGDPFDLQQLGGRMIYGGAAAAQEAAMLRRKMEQQAELQQAIELQERRLLGLNFLDLKTRSLPYRLNPPSPMPSSPIAAAGCVEEAQRPKAALAITTVMSGGAGEQESCAAAAATHDEDGSLHISGGSEHNLPDSPFASPKKPSATFFNDSGGGAAALMSPSTAMDIPPFKSCFFPVPSFSGHGAVGM